MGEGVFTQKGFFVNKKAEVLAHLREILSVKKRYFCWMCEGNGMSSWGPSLLVCEAQQQVTFQLAGDNIVMSFMTQTHGKHDTTEVALERQGDFLDRKNICWDKVRTI